MFPGFEVSASNCHLILLWDRTEDGYQTAVRHLAGLHPAHVRVREGTCFRPLDESPIKVARNAVEAGALVIAPHSTKRDRRAETLARVGQQVDTAASWPQRVASAVADLRAVLPAPAVPGHGRVPDELTSAVGSLETSLTSAIDSQTEAASATDQGGRRRRGHMVAYGLSCKSLSQRAMVAMTTSARWIERRAAAGPSGLTAAPTPRMGRYRFLQRAPSTRLLATRSCRRTLSGESWERAWVDMDTTTLSRPPSTTPVLVDQPTWSPDGVQ